MIPLLISILAIVLSIVLYHSKIGQLFIRVISIILFYLLITNFSFQVKKKITLSQPVLLVDISPSMKNYFKEIFSYINSVEFRHKRIFFSDSVYDDFNENRGRFTNITNALLVSKMDSPSSIILISDGNHNFGPSPIEQLDGFGIPVFCFGTGHKKITDQSIINVYYPDYAFPNDTVIIEAVIEAKGLGGRPTKILLESDNIKFEKKINLTEEINRHSVEFKVLLKNKGEQRFKISLSPQPEEVDYHNNEYTFSLKIFDRKLSVLYYTDYPSFNTKFMVDYIKKNPIVKLSQIIRLSSDKYLIDGMFFSQRQIDFNQFDIIVFDNINGNETKGDLLGFLKKGKGILITGNIRGMNTFLNEILPFRLAGTQSEDKLPVKILLPFSLLHPEKEYAPVSKINRVIGINPQTTIIARAGDFPLIGYRQMEGGLIFQLNIPELGMWHFAQLNLNNLNILNQLIDDILRFLSPISKNERLILRMSKDQYQIGEKLVFNLKGYDKNLIPGTGGEFYLNFQDKKIPFFEIKPGIYEVTLFAEKAGEFIVSASGSLQGDTLKSNQVKLDIIEIDKEPEELVNERLLKDIGEKTGGDHFDLSRLKGFNPPQVQERYEVKNITFDQPFIYFIIFCLLVFDWVIRKKKGMV